MAENGGLVGVSPVASSDGTFTAVSNGFLQQLGAPDNPIVVTYTMRAYDVTLDTLVDWRSPGFIDSTGSLYTGPGPLEDIVIWAIRAS